MALVLPASSRPPNAGAVEPGVNCSSYTGPGGVCIIKIGDIWFCNETYQEGVCPTSIAAGDTVRWEYLTSGLLMHTTAECGDDCDSPTLTPLWASGRLEPGDAFEFTFTAPGEYLYLCTFHPATQRGMLRVLEAAPSPSPTPGRLGDVDCAGDIDSIDAALLLQHGAGLLRSLPCQENADTNADGTVNSVDAALVLQYVAGFLNRLPP